MNRQRAAVALLLFLLAAGPASSPARSAPSAGGARLVAIGDIHGAYEALVSILREARLIDEDNRWIGGTATWVQTGDFTDRGPGVREAMDLLISLQRQADAAGGRVIVLLANHEILNLKGDWMDAAPESFLAFADERSEERRRKAAKEYTRWAKRNADLLAAAEVPVETAEEWLERHPPGLLEYQEAIGPEGRYGRWIRTLPTVVRIDDTLFLHGGLAPKLAGSNEEAINLQVSEELERLDTCHAALVDEELILPSSNAVEMVKIGYARLIRIQEMFESGQVRSRASETRLRSQYERVRPCVATYNDWMINDDDGPHHFRGHVRTPYREVEADVLEVLEGWNAARIVVGHTTIANGRIADRFDGRVLLIDTGMLSSVYTGGRASALELTADGPRAIYLDGTREPQKWPKPAPAQPVEAEPPSLYDGTQALSLTLEAPLAELLRQPEEDTAVAATLRLADGASVPVALATYGKSRLEECDVPPLKMTAEAEAARGTPLSGLETLRLVTHCRSRPSLEPQMLLEYLIYRSYSLLSDAALRVRLVKMEYRDPDHPKRAYTAHGFFVEEIGRAAQRVGRRWLDDEKHRLADLDPEQAALLALFHHMVGNTDWSVVAGPPGERCCHNTAILGTGSGELHVALPYDFDQSGLVNAPYAEPDPKLGIRWVLQRKYRGFCAHNDRVPAAIERLNATRPQLEALFQDASLPHGRTRAKAWKYVEGFYEIVNDPDKLEKLVLGACR